MYSAASVKVLPLPALASYIISGFPIIKYVQLLKLMIISYHLRNSSKVNFAVIS